MPSMALCTLSGPAFEGQATSFVRWLQLAALSGTSGETYTLGGQMAEVIWIASKGQQMTLSVRWIVTPLKRAHKCKKVNAE